MIKNNFQWNEIPFQNLASLGFTEQMFADLPTETQAQIRNGRLSPLVRLQSEEGKPSVLARFRLARQDDGSVKVLYHVRLPKDNQHIYYVSTDNSGKQTLCKNDHSLFFSDKDWNSLCNGGVVLAKFPFGESNLPSYIHMDPLTNELVAISANGLKSNFAYLASVYQLTAPELDCLAKGEVVTFLDKEVPVSVGIDLERKSGIRIENGDEELWQQKAEDRWETYTMGVNGCWQQHEDGSLDYIPQEEMTTEMWNKIKQQNEAHAADKNEKMCIR